MSSNNTQQEEAKAKTREQVKNEAAKTREQVKQERREKREKAQNRRVRVRILPIWLRIVIIAGLICLSTLAGAAVGYSMMGNGKVMDIFKSSTWTHIIDLVEKE